MSSGKAIIAIVILQAVKGALLASADVLATRDWEFWAIEVVVLVILIIAWTKRDRNA